MPKYFPEYARGTMIGDHAIKYWNTGRFYGPNGQRMVIVQVTAEVVMFIDIDRQIEGVLAPCAFSEDAVMKGYDTNVYHPVSNQDEYCIQRDLMNHLDELKALFTVVE